MGGRRIIPALAGNTGSRREQMMPHRDHPRSRGEYDIRGWLLDAE